MKSKKLNVGTLFTPKFIISGSIILIIMFVSLFYKFLMPYDPTEVDSKSIFLPAFSKGHILGTDKIGRDLLSRLIYGGHISIVNAFLIVAFEAVIGVPIGLFCGYVGGKLDNLVMRLWDILCSLPALLLAFILVASFGKGFLTGVFAIGIAFIPLTAKLARSLILTEKKAVYVEACKSMGYSDARIIFKHILPNITTTMIAQFTLDLGAAIVSMATLSYLGLGVQPPDPDWGTLLENGMENIYQNPILLIAPTITIVLTAVSVNILSDAIQEYIDPMQRKMPTFKQYEKKAAALVKAKIGGVKNEQG